MSNFRGAFHFEAKPQRYDLASRKPNFYLSFLERECLRGGASKINIFRDIVAEYPQKKFPFCLSMSKIDEPNAK